MNRSQKWVAVEEFYVARELFNAVDVTAPLEFYGHGISGTVLCQDIDRPDSGHVFTPDELIIRSQQVYLF